MIKRLLPLAKEYRLHHIGLVILAVAFLLSIFYTTYSVNNQAKDNRSFAQEAPTHIFTVCPEGTPGQNGCDYIGGEGIQQAVDAAPVGDANNRATVFIKNGMYTLQAFNEFIFLNTTDNVMVKRKCFLDTKEKNLTLRGENKNNTILDGANSSPMSGICVQGGTVDITDLTVTGMKPETCSTDIVCSKGYGLIVVHSPIFNLNNSIISANTYGLVGKDSATIKVLNSTFTKNENYGLTVSNNTKMLVKDNIITENSDGVLSFKEAEVTIQNNQIIDNRDYGIVAQQNSTVFVSNNIIANTHQYSGINLYDDAKAIINNNIIKNTHAQSIQVAGDAIVTIKNNTLTGSKTSLALDCQQNAKCEVVNNIAYNNKDSGFLGEKKENFTRFENNLSYGNTGGPWNTNFGRWPPASNIGVNPLFVSETNGDFHLAANSPAKDAGDPSILDRDGSRSDIGAYGGPESMPDFMVVGGRVVDGSTAGTGNGVAEVQIEIYDDGIKQTKSAKTDKNGYFSVPDFVRKGDVYAVRIIDNYEVRVSPNNSWTWNLCSNGDQSTTSSSYECQSAGFNDCAGPSGNDRNGPVQRCNFVVTKKVPPPPGKDLPPGDIAPTANPPQKEAPPLPTKSNPPPPVASGRPAYCKSISISSTALNAGQFITIRSTANTDSIRTFYFSFYNMDNQYEGTQNNPKGLFFNGKPYSKSVRIDNGTAASESINVSYDELNKPDSNFNNQSPKRIQVNAYFTDTDGRFSAADANCVVQFSIK